MIDLVLDHLYLIVTGAGTARRVPGILPQLAQLGPRLVVIPTPNAARVVSVREMVLALPAGSPHRVVESYFDEAILPSPPFGLVVVAPCSFNSLNKLAAGIADNLALSVVAEAIGRGTPVIVAVSVGRGPRETPNEVCHRVRGRWGTSRRSTCRSGTTRGHAPPSPPAMSSTRRPTETSSRWRQTTF